MIDVVYLAWNRLEFTTATWAWLIAHTNWDLVSKLIVYDDGSEDGTQEFLKEAVERLSWRRKAERIQAELRIGDFRSPVAVMKHYIETSEAELFAKIDSDIAVPGNWLDDLCGVMEESPEIELLGMEAGMVALRGRDGVPFEGYGFEPATHIGGVGLMRLAAFRDRPKMPYRGRYGFTEWQSRYEPVRGWITPDLACPQLDRIPIEPWASLAERYVEAGWSRPWQQYDAEWMAPYWEWMLE